MVCSNLYVARGRIPWDFVTKIVKNSSPLPFEGNHPSASGKPSDAREPSADKDEILKSWLAKENYSFRGDRQNLKSQPSEILVVEPHECIQKYQL